MQAIAFAAIVDSVQIYLGVQFVGLVLNSIITVGAALSFWVWFKRRGFSIASPSASLLFPFSTALEIIPGLNTVLPTWTFFVASTVVREWRSERGL